MSTEQGVRLDHILVSATFVRADLAREKRRLRGVFDLTSAVHKAEYDNIKRPVGKKSSKPIEPAHKFQVNLESDSFTEEK